ncbi:interleukin-11 receptor subunit alpha isoform X2 [Trichomycterus rosablanca]|uniref:interleukin-11 receptor subunit alpha isoform X2 n=1 Tax=Trichomycterus rosablanca TaxID=2290929 RepID=UPI002F3533D3
MPGLLSCSGGLIRILTLCSVLVNSELLSNEVSDVQFGSLGSSVTLTCGSSYRGSPVQWTHNGSSVQARNHNSDGSLTLTNTTPSMEGNYSCHESRGEVLHSVRLRLGYLPGHLSVSCKVPSHYYIHCTWTQRVTTYLPTIYIASYSVDNGKPEPCEQERIDLNKCTISNPSFWAITHLVNITEVNPLGSKSTIASVDMHKTLKPDPVEALHCEGVKGEPTQLHVVWQHPVSWPANLLTFPLKYEVQYRPVGSNLWSKLESEDLSTMIMDALVGHLHHIRVRAQDYFINHSQWSEWSQVVQGQPWSDPSLNPDETTEEILDGLLCPATFPVRATEKSPDSSFDDNESQDLLIILGLLAAVMAAVVFVVTVILWMRKRRRGSVTKQELTSMMKMKSLPI